MKQKNISSILPNTEEFYKNFRNKLEENHDFPTNYTFKFIIKNKSEFLTEIYRIFDDTHNVFSTKESSNRKYISCTISTFVIDADQIIRLYKETAKIDGIVML